MPYYLYEIIGRKKGKKVIEIFQDIHAPPLTEDPKTGLPIRRILCPPFIPKNRFDRFVKKYSKKDPYLKRLYQL